jgi:hypothetical protein
MGCGLTRAQNASRLTIPQSFFVAGTSSEPEPNAIGWLAPN